MVRVADSIVVNPWWHARPAIVALNLFTSAWVFHIPLSARAPFSPAVTAWPVGPFAVIPTTTPFVLTSTSRKLLVRIAPRVTKWKTADVATGARAILCHVSPYGVGSLLDRGRDWRRASEYLCIRVWHALPRPTMVTIPLVSGCDVVLELLELSSNAASLSFLACGRARRSRMRRVLFRDRGVRVATLSLT